MAAQDAPILIVGGGIGGLAAARALALTGRRVHVLEQGRAFGEIGAGIQLSPNVFRMFERLGIEDAIRADAVFVDDIRFMDSLTGEAVMKVPLKQPFEARFGKPYAVTHRGDLHTTLLKSCQELDDRIVLETEAKVTGYTDQGDRVTVRLADGTAREGRALIGADGLWSKIRAQMLNDGPPRVSGHIAYRAVLPYDQVPVSSRCMLMLLVLARRDMWCQSKGSERVLDTTESMSVSSRSECCAVVRVVLFVALFPEMACVRKVTC